MSGQDVFSLVGVSTNGGLVCSALWLEALSMGLLYRAGRQGVEEYVRRSDLILNIE
jgi:hypothetical protein